LSGTATLCSTGRRLANQSVSLPSAYWWQQQQQMFIKKATFGIVGRIAGQATKQNKKLPIHLEGVVFRFAPLCIL
jgi:hypothetical protein